MFSSNSANDPVFMTLVLTAAAILIGLFFASIHERVLARVTLLFNKILAFFIGAALVVWIGTLLAVTYGWIDQSSRYRRTSDLLGMWSGLVGVLLCGILVIGLTTTLADIRENVRRIANRPQPPSPRKSPAQPAPPPVSLATPYPEEPSLTDEEKVQLAKDLVRNAQLKSMPKTIDEETPTEP
jgi:hypothetical protein